MMIRKSYWCHISFYHTNPLAVRCFSSSGRDGNQCVTFRGSEWLQLAVRWWWWRWAMILKGPADFDTCQFENVVSLGVEDELFLNKQRRLYREIETFASSSTSPRHAEDSAIMIYVKCFSRAIFPKPQNLFVQNAHIFLFLFLSVN